MKTPKTSVKVNSILFESNDSEVLIKGNVKAGPMNYDSDLIITHSQLNTILNKLQKQNKTSSINDFITSEKMYDGEILFSANFSTLEFNTIDLNDLEREHPLKQIRA